MISFRPCSINDKYRGNSEEPFAVIAKPSGEDILNIVSQYQWSPIIWRDGERLETNFLESHYCALDIDEGMSLADAKRRFCDLSRIIGTTRSHQKQKKESPPCDRFRLVFKWERPIKDLSEYKYNVKMLIKRYGADRNCSDGARMLFPCRRIEEVAFGLDGMLVADGPTQDEQKAIAERYLKNCERAAGFGMLPPFSQHFLSNKVPGNSLHQPRFKFACEAARSGLSFDDAMRRLLRSPNYAGKDIDSKLLKELERVMASGFVAVENTKAP